MTGALVLNGDKYLGKIDGDYVVCCDAGYEKSDRCDILIGDMDSVSSYKMDNKVIKLNSDKDMTDGEAGIDHLIEKGADRVIIYGLDGGRLDHILANVSLMARCVKAGVECEARGNGYRAYMIDKDSEFDATRGQYVSLSPFTDEVHIIVSQGLRYNLYDFTLSRYSSLSYCNTAMKDRIRVNIDKGLCLVVINDKGIR